MELALVSKDFLMAQHEGERWYFAIGHDSELEIVAEKNDLIVFRVRRWLDPPTSSLNEQRNKLRQERQESPEPSAADTSSFKGLWQARRDIFRDRTRTVPSPAR
jgi:hypothetical protein